MEHCPGEQPFITFAEHSPDVIFRLDCARRFVYINPAIEPLVGRPPADFLGKTPREAGLPGPWWRAIENLCQEALSCGRPQAREFTEPTPEGTRFLQVRVIPEAALEGAEPFLLGVIGDQTERRQAEEQLRVARRQADCWRDISERKQMEEALRESEEFTRRIADIAPSILYVYDLDVHRNVWGNREMLGGLGYTREQLKAMGGHLLDILLHPDDQVHYQHHATRLHGLADEEVAEFEYRLRHADGSWRWLYSRDMVFRRTADGRVRQIVGAALDITARKQAEAALHAAHDTFQHLVQHSPFGIYAVDADFRLVQVSTGAQKVFQNVRPLLGRDFAEVLRCIWTEPFASAAIARFRHTLETGEPYHSASTVERRQDIHEVESYDWKIERLTLPDGRFGVVCHFYDLSERQRYEAALQEADRHKDKFLAMLAHELRNPLAPIRNAVQILRLSELKEPALQTARDMIERQVAHLVRLVDDLLDMSRVARGQIQLQKLPLDLAAVVQQAVETSRPLIEARRHRLSVTLPAEPVHVEGDFTRLTQVVSNLLNNAAKYTEEGGQIGLSVEQTRPRNESPHAVIRVCDTGRGIDPSALKHLFELFYQADRHREHADGGLGIGLALVKSLVAMHGGQVEARSAGYGQGSEFVVRLPRLREAVPAPQAEAPGAPPPATHRLRILVVDDNRDSAESLALLLQINGHQVLAAHDGRQAVEVALQERPDVVLLDIGLPYLDGYQACRALRRGGLREALIVAMTGYGQAEDRCRSREVGFDHHLLKPVDLAVLKQLLAEYMPAVSRQPPP